MYSSSRTSRWMAVSSLLLLPVIVVVGFVSPNVAVPTNAAITTRPVTNAPLQQRIPPNLKSTTQLFQQLSVRVDDTLDDDKITALFAWIARAYAGDDEYNNLMIAIAAIFGDLPKDSEPVVMAEKALAALPKDAEEIPYGEPFSLYEREANSLGAMVRSILVLYFL